MQESLDASLVRIRTGDGGVVGAGFLVGERQILTCAHVVSQALGLADHSLNAPQSMVSLDFPFVAPYTLFTARVVQWCPLLADGRGDIAGLELQGTPPTGAEVVRFAPAEDMWEHPFRAFGFPAGYNDGVWATGRLLGRQATDWVMIEDVKAQGFAVGPGFSGTPVWDTRLHGVVGMVVAASRPADTKAAFVLPLDVLVAAWPLIEPIARPRIFLSAASADADFATRLATDLEVRGIVVWNEQHVPAEDNTDKDERIRQAIRAAQAIVLVVSSQTRSSRTVKEHLHLADLYKRRLIFVWVGDDASIQPQHYDWPSTVWIDAHNTRYTAALDAIEVSLSQRRSISALLGPSYAAPEEEPRNPYKGLQAFTTDDAGDFFGRDRLVDALVKDVAGMLVAEHSTTNNERLLTIIGPSGSGKSSVVMAGLLPDLQGGAVPGSEAWVYLEPMVPSKHPIEALGLTLAAHFPDRSFTSIREDLEDDAARGLHVLVMQLVKQRRASVMLLVDQFEELFTQTESEDERRRFIDLLLTAASESRGPLLVLLTLRADFYHRLMQYPELYHLIEAHHEPVLPMVVDDLRAVIEQPAALPDVQLTFEGNLVGDLLFEMQGQVGGLPLLQFTLEQLFQRRNGHRLTLQAYREIGGVKGALSKHAEATYAALPSEEHHKLARALFLRLIDPGITEQDTTRRRAALSELSLPDPAQTTLLREVTDIFIAARLLTTNEIAGTTTVEVSHEALIREWARLSGWMREAREDIPLQQTLSKDVAAWKQRGHPKDRLYRGSQLKEARTWAKRNTPSKDEAAFLQASAVRRMRFMINMLAVFLLVVLTIGLAASWPSLLPKPDPTYVTTLHDDGPGSLRWDLANAPPGSTISFDKSLWGHTILLTRNLPIANKNLSIRGPSVGRLTISSSTHQVEVLPGASIRILDLTFKGSKSNSASLLRNEGTLTLTNSTVSGNSAPGRGGGIYNDTGATLTLTNSTILGNLASGRGGGIVNLGTLTLTNSTVSGNSLSGPASDAGGGIANFNTLTLINSTVSGNFASNGIGGGGIANFVGATILTLINSTVSGNSASNGGTGGIANGAILTLTNSTVSGNSASGQYSVGGIYSAGTLALTNSTVSGNSASGQDSIGGILNYGGYNGGKLALTNSTVSGNSASGQDSAGGIENIIEATLALTNSTVSGNSASGQDSAGGIYNYGSKADITFCTIYGNKAAGNGGGLSTVDGQDVNGNNLPSQVSIRNSIVAGDHTPTDPDISGRLTSDGYNLIQDISGASFTPNKQHLTDILGDKFSNLGIDPLLRDNGGLAKPYTFTHALLLGSPAIDIIPLEVCHANGKSVTITADQRGMKRPDGNESACDIGAYEYVDSST